MDDGPRITRAPTAGKAPLPAGAPQSGAGLIPWWAVVTLTR